LEALDASVGVRSTSNRVLSIEVLDAKTEFEYGFTIAIDRAACTLEVELSIGDKRWKEKLQSALKGDEEEDPTIGANTTAAIEKVWDDIAIQVVRSIMQHL
jgi:hypothetical protein